MLTRNLTFVAADPPRASFFAAWDPERPGGLGSETSIDLELLVPARRGTQRQVTAAEAVTMTAAIDALASLRVDDDASPSARAWAAVVRTALSLIAAGKVLPWVSPVGYDSWRVDPIDPIDQRMVDALVASLPAVAHATPAGGRGAISDPTHSVRAVFDAVADTFLRTPAAHRVGSLRIFADRKPTKVPHLRSWVNDVASAHCASSRLVLRMHPPTGADAPTTILDGAAEQSRLEQSVLEPWRVTFALQSRADPSLLVPAEQYWTAPTEVMDRLGNQAETTLLAGLRTVTQLVEPWADLLDDIAPTQASLHGAELDTFLDQLDALDRADIEVRWPSDLVAPRITRQLVVSAGAPTSHLQGTLGLDAVLDVDWEFMLEGSALSADELRILAQAKRSVVALRGRWVRLDRATLDKLRAPAPTLGITTALAVALGAELDLTSDADGDLEIDPGESIAVKVVGSLEDFVAQLRNLSGERMAPTPAALQADLRDYQRRGLAWMSDLCGLGLGGCLADDMGLGKTIQILALHAARRDTTATDAHALAGTLPTGRVAACGPTLVVCPTSLMNNWAREAARFVPDYPVHIHHGASRGRPDLTADTIVVTSYGVLRSDAELLGSIEWDLVVADEAQHAKNPRSRTARALRAVPHGVRLALTGTPVENNLSELWSIVDWTVPGLLGSLAAFRRTMALPIERDGDRAATDRLQRLIQPFLLRRTKTDEGIAPELPAKIERDVVVPLTDEQVTLYRATTEQVLAEVAGAEGIDRRGLILKLLTGLKQITNHPAQFLGETGPLDARSGKLDALGELLASGAAAGESTLVFTQYVAMANLIQDHQIRRGRRIAVLHGGLSVRARQELVDRFQAGDLQVLVLSLKAGGTGLNLTAATSVVHFDRWWNPAVEDQATDRAYRIGQSRTVTVHRIITQGTVEDRVADLLAAKRDLAASVTGAGESWIGDLSDDDLAELVELSTTEDAA